MESKGGEEIREAHSSSYLQSVPPSISHARADERDEREEDPLRALRSLLLLLLARRRRSFALPYSVS